MKTTTDPNFDNLTIRTLTAEDSDMYRVLRQKVLKIGDGKYFNTSFEREKQLSEQEWREWCAETEEHCIIGTFIDEKLIGVMMITRFGDLDEKTVEWEATWFDPAYRGQGIAKKSYKKVQEWTKEHGYRYAKVFIRDDNARSRAIREKQGFVYQETLHNEVWADGSIASEHVFVKDLCNVASQGMKPCVHVMAKGEHSSDIKAEQQDLMYG